MHPYSFETDDIAFMLSPTPPDSPQKATGNNKTKEEEEEKEKEQPKDCQSIIDIANVDYKLKNKRQRMEIVALLEDKTTEESCRSVNILSLESLGDDDRDLQKLLSIHSNENKEFERKTREEAVRLLKLMLEKLETAD